MFVESKAGSVLKETRAKLEVVQEELSSLKTFKENMMRRMLVLPDNPKPIINEILGLNKCKYERKEHIDSNKYEALELIFTWQLKHLKENKLVAHRAMAHFMIQPAGDPNAYQLPVIIFQFFVVAGPTGYQRV